MIEFDEKPVEDAWPKKFSWPMRICLCIFIGDMLLRSTFSLFPIDEWCQELHLVRYPRSLPTVAELAEIDAGTREDGVASAAGRLTSSIGDVPGFFLPVPSEQSRVKLTNSKDAAQYAAAWLVTRMKFIGNIVGVRQDWTMFSPNTVTGDTLARFRLVYGDNSIFVHRTIVDPIDPTRIGHFGDAKARRNVGKAHEDVDVRVGYCRWLAGRFGVNAAGSQLMRIEVFKVRYEYPGPYDNARAFLAAQTGPPIEQQEPTFWIYDVETRNGKYVD